MSWIAPIRSFWRRSPVTATFLVLLLSMYILSAIAVKTGLGNFYQSLLLQPDLVVSRPWSLLSYALLHDLRDPSHLLLNGLALFFFLRMIEDDFGSRITSTLIATTALGGGALVFLAYLAGFGSAPVVGASAVALGATAAVAMLYPQREILLYFVPVRAQMLLVFLVIMLVLDAVSANGTSAAAHAGGMLAAALLVKGVGFPRLRSWLHPRLTATKKGASSKGAPYLTVVPPYNSAPKSGKNGENKNWIN